MIALQDILVGVDLSSADRLVSDDLPVSTVEAIERAIWAAELSGAKLHLLAAIDIGAKAQQALQDDEAAESTVLTEAKRILGRLAAQAQEQGIEAITAVSFGRSWHELTQYVLRAKCDLVIVGAKQRSALEQIFIGSTGMNLLRYCPCPVWVTHPPREGSHGAILVAHDLTAVGNLALELGALLAEIYRAPLHVVHVVEASQLNLAEPLAPFSPIDEDVHQVAKERITNQLLRFKLAEPAEIHVIDGSPDVVLREQINQHDIDLLVMGTIARGGIQGLLIGNTAERLLPQVPCSVLAVKPTDFRTPVSWDESS